MIRKGGRLIDSCPPLLSSWAEARTLFSLPLYTGKRTRERRGCRAVLQWSKREQRTAAGAVCRGFGCGHPDHSHLSGGVPAVFGRIRTDRLRERLPAEIIGGNCHEDRHRKTAKAGGRHPEKNLQDQGMTLVPPSYIGKEERLMREERYGTETEKRSAAIL